MSLTLIGDVHGKIDDYNRIASQHKYSLCLGDVGFNYGGIDLDPAYHRAILGNHDNYDTADYCSLFLDDYGSFKLGGIKFFFVRGAFSIDMPYRIAQYRMAGTKSWWHQEELTLFQMIDCWRKYKRAKPKYVFTHTCPSSISEIVGSSRILEEFGLPGFVSKTNQLLQLMLEFHKPLVWVFGHFHKSWKKNIGRTMFVCLNELETLTIEEKNGT